MNLQNVSDSMIPNPNRSVFPKNRTWFAILMISKSGRCDIYHTLFFTEGEAHSFAVSLLNRKMLDDFKIYPVRPETDDSFKNRKPLWY